MALVFRRLPLVVNQGKKVAQKLWRESLSTLCQKTRGSGADVDD